MSTGSACRWLSGVVLLLWLPACGTPEDSGGSSGSGAGGALASCGNGVQEPDEACDDGAANSDTAPDACRTTCRLPSCGDGVTDGGEDCDDGNPWGGDGCAPPCTPEAGPGEEEPNDTWDGAQAADLETDLYGALPEGDVDCYAVPVPRCHAVRATMGGACDTAAVLRLHAPDGVQVAAGGGSGACPVLEPADEPGARFLDAGTWAVCAAPLLDGVLPAYHLRLETLDSGSLGLALGALEDIDGDGYRNSCDDDIDGDSYPNDDDNCPEIPNGADATPLAPDDSGFLRHWLTIGPFTGNTSPDTCLPSDLDLLGEDDGLAAPVLGDRLSSGQVWRAQISPDARLDFLNYADVGAPREVYAVTYLHNPSARPVVLALGPDDGARAWLDGQVVLEVSGCQGTNVDQFTADLTLSEGWHQLTLKVYDQGGGWGTYVRFLDAASRAPLTDLDVSLVPGALWVSDQSDLDGDGVGDVCDETPAG